MSRALILAALIASYGCTTHYQVRGTEQGVIDRIALDDLVGNDDLHRARQISTEHQSIEQYTDFALGIIEVTDEGGINETQKKNVMDWVVEETAGGGLLVVFVHGWHHGARTCDRDLCCFRAVLDDLAKNGAGGSGKVVGLYLGWRGESLPYRRWNVFTIWDRKRVAEHIGRTAGKEILLEVERRAWVDNPDLVMVTIGHSLGGAMVFQAVKGRLTGNISDIELGKVRSYRVVRAEESRVEALAHERKAIRAGFGDLVVLVNPAIEASEYVPFDADLRDDRVTAIAREELIRERLPYDKKHDYDPLQMPVLMTVASEADTAVGRIFPMARLVQAITRPRYLKRPYWTGMGRYAPQITHRLEAPDRYAEAAQAVSGDCGCSKVARGLSELPPMTLSVSSAQGIDGVGGGVKFGLTEQRLDRGWDPNSPYLVVETNRGVISEHSDIFNPTFVAFLQAYINAYDAKYEGLPTESKRQAN